MKEKISILIVDDEEMMRALIEKILVREGYQITTAVDGRDALEKLEAEQFQMIISDMKMPHIDGFELLKAVKQEYPETSVIIMTAYGDTYSVKDALLLGADEYITKPFKSHEITLIVERCYWRILTQGKEAEQAS
ncbi:MAG: response regulator [bacterium]|nr:response regulator [bacterium]